MEKILIVDDEVEIADLISDALSDEGFDTLTAYDGEAGLEVAKNNPDISLILLDIMMPKIDGLTLCRKIRDAITCPIIFISAKSRTLDVVVGLEMGADDYITKPFVVEELVAKVKAHIRRDRRSNVLPDSTADTITIGEFELHKDSYDLLKNKERVMLSTREFQLLEYLMENAGKVLSREDIFNHVWGSEYGDIGTVAVNIKNLRNKIDEEGKYIKTVWGVGYKFVSPFSGE
ncbi:MAG: response regulator transcription factor [Ruminococcaceae bacterium]|nr:response regulator transcription factor [Oscillospiraceae bacterium]